MMTAEDTARDWDKDASAQGGVREDGALPGATPRAEIDPTPARAHRMVADDLYGAIPVSRWAQSLLELAPFRRLNGVSLSDVPGELLLNCPFPSRLTHSLGVYYLARQSRPRDRALQAAALAHDLGHGPFSHLIEPLMIERLGMRHEERSTALLREAVTHAQGNTARLLSWLDLDEVSALITRKSVDGRGALLNGLLDYDNLDHVARFAMAAGLCETGYDGRALARGLRIAPGADGRAYVALADDLREEAVGWQANRAEVFGFLQSNALNVAAHGMLRKAIDLAARDCALDEAFFDETDVGALRRLRRCPSSRPLVERALAREPYAVIWEADAPTERSEIGAVFAGWRQRLALEDRIAAESGLPAREVVVVYMVSRVARALPSPLSQAATSNGATASAHTPGQEMRLLAPAGAGRDYLRRARMAAERALGELGATPRGWPELR
jgi:uncharacterized protein